MSCNAGAFARRDLILSDRIRNIPFITRHSPEGYIVSNDVRSNVTFGELWTDECCFLDGQL
jgi:hypothetical protein